MADPNVSSIGATGRDYATITLWEDAVDGDLVTRAQREKGECYADSDFNETVDFDGSTTNSSYYMWLTVAEGQRHNGTISGGGVVIDRGGSGASTIVINCNDDYCLIEWLRITNTANTVGALSHIDLGNASNCIARNCICHDASTNAYMVGIQADIGSAKVENCQVFNLTNNGSNSARGIGCTEDTKVFNCTVYNIVKASTGSAYCYYGQTAFTDPEMKNCIGMDGDTVDFYQCGTAKGANYNLSSDATAPGANSLKNKLATDQFISITGGSENLLLKCSADARDSGIGPALDADVPTTDIVGNTRSGDICDIGSNECQVAPVSGSVNPLLNPKRIGKSLINGGMLIRKILDFIEYQIFKGVLKWSI